MKSGEKRKKDRIKPLLVPLLEDYSFKIIRKDILDKLKVSFELKDIPTPFRKEDLQDLLGDRGLSLAKVAENMGYVVGCDTEFKYAESYRIFMKKVFREDLPLDVEARAIAALKDKRFFDALVMLRLAIFLEPKEPRFIYNYALACQNIYKEVDLLPKKELLKVFKDDISGSDEAMEEALVGIFKAEALENFEKVTIDYPELIEAHYNLAFMYLNLGLYKKSQLEFLDFLNREKEALSNEKMAAEEGEILQDFDYTEYNQRRKAVEEVEDMLRRLEDPCKIEEGCNFVIRGMMAEGLGILNQYKDVENFKKWWPLHFYRGIALKDLDELMEAKVAFKQALRLNGSHIESLEAMRDISALLGDVESYEKYSRKIDIIEESK